MAGGNFNVILCERGIRSFEKRTRNTLDLNAVPLVKNLSHLPVIVDPSHGTGSSELVPSMSLAALAAGADGLIVEVHPNPKEAVSDGDQSLDLEEFDKLMKSIKRLLSVMPEKTLEGSKCSVAA
jgi:3-deoxy-7-phosphoheptulonate synthase